MSETKQDSLTVQNMIADYKSVTLGTKGNIQVLNVENRQASCKVSLFGAHVLSFIPQDDKRERLWLSDDAVFDGVKAIRGGIPICWPWFSAHPTEASFPSHGYARTQNWDVQKINEILDNNKEVLSTEISLIPKQTSLYGYENIQVKLVIEVSNQLRVSLVTKNDGPVPLALYQALHTYFQVDNVDNIEVHNINEPYSDKPTGKDNCDVTLPYIIEDEVDRIHVLPNRLDDNQEKQVTIINNQKPTLHQKISMNGIDSVVVWNPGEKLGNSMSDVHENGYRTMLCIEAANTEKANEYLLLLPNQSHSVTQQIS